MKVYTKKNIPAKPTYNGGIERVNKIFREEFYHLNILQVDNIDAIQNALVKEVKKYNTYRPHYGLQELTSMNVY